MEVSPGLDDGLMTNKVFLTPAPVRLLESHGQSLIALIPNHVICELQRDREEQLQHVLESVRQRGGQCLPTPWTPHDEQCHAIALQWSDETSPHRLDSECQPLSSDQGSSPRRSARAAGHAAKALSAARRNGLRNDAAPDWDSVLQRTFNAKGAELRSSRRAVSPKR